LLIILSLKLTIFLYIYYAFQWPGNIYMMGQTTINKSTNHTHKTKDRVIRTPLKTGVNSGAPEG